MNVPASIRSGITVYSHPCNSRTPSTTIRGVPCPVIDAPHWFKKFARSTTSGSHAAISITVVPSASAAADMAFAVPRTVDPNGPPRNISRPRSRFAFAMMSPPVSSTSAPRFRSARM